MVPGDPRGRASGSAGGLRAFDHPDQRRGPVAAVVVQPVAYEREGRALHEAVTGTTARLKAYYETKIFGEVEINAVKKKVQEQEGRFLLLDARPRDAFVAGHIPGALSIPLEQAAEAANSLPITRQYVTYCWGHT